MQTIDKPKILLVDDEPRVLRSLKANLRHEYEVFLANDGQEAIKILKNTHNISIVITDERMPILSGHELLIWLKQNQPKVIRILITGFAKTDIIQILDQEVVEYFKFDKPWDISTIKSTLGKILNLNKQPVSKHTLIESIKKQEKYIITFETHSKYQDIYSQIQNYLNIKVLSFNNVTDLLKTINKNKSVPVIIIDVDVGINNYLKISQVTKKIIPKTAIIALTPTNHPLKIKIPDTKKVAQTLDKPFTINQILPLLMKSIHQFKNIQGRENLHVLSQIWDK